MIQSIKLANYIDVYGEHWADDLPENCPPEDVCVAEGDDFYRFTQEEDTIREDDWFNYLTLLPNNHFTEEQKVLASGLSLVDSLDAAEKKLLLPGMKKFKGIACISLIPEDGVILQTGCSVHHFTWWRTTMCDLTKAQIL